MDGEDDFEPRLGRQRASGGRRPKGYANRVAQAAGLHGRKRARGGSGKGGKWIGRGSGAGRVLAGRTDGAGAHARRVVVKTSLVRLRGKGLGAARAHLAYVQRDGVTREGAPGELYSRESDRADGREFLARAGEDRHQFRFIVSPEDGDQYQDLKPFVRDLMNQMERDLDTKLDWVAVDHANTGHPHSHIVLRGIDDRGRDLVIARDYISHGIRERASDIVTRDLGPRSEHEIEVRLRREIDLERLTSIDRGLLGRMDANREIVTQGSDVFRHGLETGRLRTLERMELAQDLGAGRWRLADDLAQTLREMGQRGDIVALMQREMSRAKVQREPQIHERQRGALVGRVVTRGLADEHRDRHFLLIDGTDGRGHFVDLGQGGGIEALPDRAIVRVTPRAGEVLDVDRTVAAIAERNDGRYSQTLHRLHHSSARDGFIEAHVRRLEALRRGGVDLDRDRYGTWRIPGEHLEQVRKFEERKVARQPFEVEVLAKGKLENLALAQAPTWLDRELESPSHLHARDAGFGRELRGALAERRQWLIDQDLGESRGQGFRLKPGAMAVLQRCELLTVAADLSKELGKPFVESQPGHSVEGTIARRVEGVSSHFALVEKGRDFTLVPWREVLAKRIGKEGGGIMRESGINWRFGRGRSGPEIS